MNHKRIATACAFVTSAPKALFLAELSPADPFPQRLGRDGSIDRAEQLRSEGAA